MYLAHSTSTSSCCFIDSHTSVIVATFFVLMSPFKIGPGDEICVVAYGRILIYKCKSYNFKGEFCHFCASSYTQWNCRNIDCFQTSFLNNLPVYHWSDSHAPNPRHWLSMCCYGVLMGMLKPTGQCFDSCATVFILFQRNQPTDVLVVSSL